MTNELGLFHLELLALANVHKKYNMQKFNEMNLTTGQPKVLSILLKKEGYLQKDLAKRCHIEPATLTTILKNMEMKNLIYKIQESVSGGKKAYSIHLTPHGREAAERVEEVVRASEKISFQGFSEEEKAQMLQWMEKIQNNLEKQLEAEEEEL